MLRHGILKLGLAVAALVAISAPVLAAGLPACCAPVVAQAAARPACCPMKAAAAMPKGCCKAPEAPKPESRIKQAAPAVVVAAAAPSVAMALVSSEIPVLVAAHVARREHRAPSPDDSPPDRLSRNHILLI